MRISVMKVTILFGALVALRTLHGQNWPVYGGDLGNTRYSALDQINTQNVSHLAPAWVFDTRPQAAENRTGPRKPRPWW